MLGSLLGGKRRVMHPTPADASHALSYARRRRVRAAASASALMLAPHAASPPNLRPTPANAEGPFYPPQKPADTDADLTQVRGTRARAKGTVLLVTGRVLDVKGSPMSTVRCSRSGRRTPSAAISIRATPMRRDGSIPTSRATRGSPPTTDGNYRIKTIKPPPYGGRTPHIHFIVASRSTRLTTQMFFEGEATNERDFLYRYLSTDDRRASTARFATRRSRVRKSAVCTLRVHRGRLA